MIRVSLALRNSLMCVVCAFVFLMSGCNEDSIEMVSEVTGTNSCRIPGKLQLKEDTLERLKQYER